MQLQTGTLLLSSDLHLELEQLASPISKPASAVLFRRGEEAKGIFVIHEGKIRLTLDEKARFYPPRIVGRGSIVGLPATLSGSPYSLTAEVVEDAELGFITRKDLIKFLRTRPAVCFELMQSLSEEISDMRATFKNASARPY